VDIYDARSGEVICAASHGNRHIKSTGTHSQGAYPSGCGCVAVGSQQGFTGPGESLQVDLMANAVSRSGEIDAILLRDGFQVGMIVCIFKSNLYGVVIDIADRKLSSDII